MEPVAAISILFLAVASAPVLFRFAAAVFRAAAR